MYHLSMQILLVCFQKLNKSMEPRTAQKKRPPSSTSVKPGSRFLGTPTSTPGEASEVEKAALNIWRTVLFEHFQDRLLAAALAKITEDRDASFHQINEPDSSMHSEAPAQTLNALSTASSAPVVDQKSSGQHSSNTKDIKNNKKDIWVPMGGDRIVSQLVENVLRLGDALPLPMKLNIYEEALEKPYISSMEDYYTRESSSYIETQGITRGISLALLRLDQEEQRASRNLHPSSKPKVISALHKRLIDAHKEAMLVEFELMLRSDRKAHLRSLYALLSRQEDGCQDLRDSLSQFIVQSSNQALKSLVEVATAEVADQAAASSSRPAAKKRTKNDRGAAANVSPTAYVDTLTQLYARFSELVVHAFNDDSSFVTAMDRAYKLAVNALSLCDDPSLGPELLARQSDVLLRKGSVPLSESDLELKLQQLVTVFKYVDDKDIFQNIYSKLLAKRLIGASSVSEDAERATIASLKSLCSSEFVLRVQRMFTDIQTSKEATTKFQSLLDELSPASESNSSVSLPPATSDGSVSTEETNLWRKSKPSVPLDFSVFVLTTGSWPMHERADSFHVPEMISEYLTLFSHFYNSMHTGRKLNWMYNMHRGEVKILFARKNYDVGATGFQLAMLLAFDSPLHSSLSVDQLTVILGLPTAETMALAKNLVDCKLLVLATPSVSSGTEGSDSAMDIVQSTTEASKDASSSSTEATEDSTKAKAKAKTSLHGGSLLSLNRAFTNKKIKFKLPPPPPTDAAKAAALASAREEIDGDRIQYLQAVIVRTMKTRKTLTHTQLVQEVLDQSKSRFKASIPFIKRQIDSLIEMEYLMRSKEKADIYQYCA